MTVHSLVIMNRIGSLEQVDSDASTWHTKSGYGTGKKATRFYIAWLHHHSA